jgi:hypothetical protein
MFAGVHAAAEADALKGEIPVTLRVIDDTASALTAAKSTPTMPTTPQTGDPTAGTPLLLLIFCCASLAVCALCIILHRNGKNSKRSTGASTLLLGVAVTLALAAGGAGVSAAQSNAGESAHLIVIDKRQTLTGSGEIGLDLSALNSKVIDIDASAALLPKVQLSFNNVVLTGNAQTVASISDKDFSGTHKAMLNITIDKTLAAGDYSITVGYTATDRRAPIASVLAAFDARVYDGTTAAVPRSAPVIAGKTPQDTVELSGLSFNAASKNVGQKIPVTAQAAQLTGPDAWKYRLGDPRKLTVYTDANRTDPATIDITPKLLTIDAGNLVIADKVYDGNTSATAQSGTLGTLTGIIGGDNVSLSGTASSFSFDNKNAGTNKPVQYAGGLALTGASAGNYTFSAAGITGLTADITPKLLTVNASVQDKIYDGSTDAEISGTLVTSGIVGGDQVSLAGANIQGTFADKNAGQNKTVTVAGGGYALGGSSAGNYRITQPTGLTATIEKAPLAFTGTAFISYESAFVFTVELQDPTKFSGLVSGEGFTAGKGSVTEVTVPQNENYERGPEVIPNASIDGALLALTPGAGTSADNYSFTQPQLRIKIARPFILEVITSKANQTVTLNKYFGNAYSIDWGDNDSLDPMHFGAETHTYTAAGTYQIELTSKLTTARRWTFTGAFEPLVPLAGTTADTVTVKSMPPMRSFMPSDTDAGDNFFYGFNVGGKLSALPAGSFDLGAFTKTGNSFFSYFNSGGKLGALPGGSFNTGNIAAAGDYFFASFNSSGQLSSLPDGSFDTGKIVTAHNNFFYEFNCGGKLSELPIGSFNTGNITTAGNNFFTSFNDGGKLGELPAGSFNTGSITAAGKDFFSLFNNYGLLKTLPVNSFDTGKITAVGEGFFGSFNESGKLSSLPAGSFRLNSNLTATAPKFFIYFNKSGQLGSLPAGSFNTGNITTAGSNFFFGFNNRGGLTRLTDGSFNTSNITTAGANFFDSFNREGELLSLPGGSFNTDKLATVGNYFLASFNHDGKMDSLPAGSFDTSRITTVGSHFFHNFNYNGRLTSLPASFKWPPMASVPNDSSFSHAFSSPNYTIDRDASAIINGCATPSPKRWAFSPNQPGYSSLADEWKG